jgi:hypothetical protein
MLRRWRWDHLVTEQILALALMLNPAHDRAVQAHMARLAGRLGFVACHLPLGEDATLSSSELEVLISAAEPALLIIDHAPSNDDEVDAVGMVRTADPEVIRRARARLDGDEDNRPLIVAVPLSIGRTMNEAVARADLDPRFVGDAHPRVSGIFGTFEQAQEQVLAIAQAGAEVLLVTVPDERDVADVLAQTRALVVGAAPVMLGR